MILFGALIFLFVNTQAVDFKREAPVLALLREMRDHDARWDIDASRLANDFSPPEAAKVDRGQLIGRMMQQLEGGPAREKIAEQLPVLRAGIAAKDAAFKALLALHGQSLAAFKALDEALGALEAAATSQARANTRLSALVALIDGLRDDLNRPNIETFAERRPALERRIAGLRREAVATDPALAVAAARVESAGRDFLAARANEVAAWQKFSFNTVGARIELTARTLSKAIETALDEQDRWRIYLFAYATALLIGVGYLALRVVAAQSALLSANEELEKRVAERTHDLAQTLRRLKESESQLVQSEKMSSLGQLVAGVAHEINTPLAYVKNSVETAREQLPELRDLIAQAGRLVTILRSSSPDPRDLQDTYDALAATLGRLSNHHVINDLEALTKDGLHGIEQIVELVTNLRNFSRLDRSKVASFNVNDGVQSTLLIARSSLRKVDVEQHLGEVPSITCSPSQVNQVLLNLLSNAAQAIDKPRGRITITTRAADAGSVTVEVADNGRGIAPEVLPKIFDPFFTTKEVGKGTGLGLSIAYKIISQHGGRIDVRSEAGVGTTFTVTLPIQPPADFAADIEASVRS